ncbi:LRR receptor-like serine/threonine-protein kinase GSO1 [Nymphaea colorata]|uniref:LRR receptor-like serine/threonine-protein kinase GSO1 n=1 Tax=Nymphaea colorata TaxID=210225 RepID=UPI00129D4BF6|nr:LRR receptor-like serine/threonine-protein kinase GSO1 [Nymphaea colorata]
MEKLQELTLSGNALERSIPNSLYQLVHMGNLYLDNNALSGPISTSINNLTNLQMLYLNSNSFSSALPPALCELKDLIWLYLQDNSFTVLLPLDVGNLVAVDKMDISVNQLSGELPVSLSELQSLEYLNLSKNSVNGNIHGNIDVMVNIKIIDLSYNNLCGGIPKSLENLQQPQVLDLSFNRLERAIASGGNFTNLSIDSFVGNYALCGAPKFHVPVCSDGVKKHNIVNMIKVDIFLASGGFMLLLIVWILIFVEKYRKSGLERHYHEVERFHGIVLPVITYRMFSQATINFSDANFMGTGSFGSVRKPTDESFNGDFTLRQWVAEVFPLPISDVINGHLLKQNSSETVSDHAAEGHLLKQNNSGTVLNELLVMIMETGLSCSRKAPTERMGMKAVVARLKTIQRKASPLKE